ncbi:MAG TPA: lactate utilization protein [Kineosporiaceae bacterium]
MFRLFTTRAEAVGTEVHRVGTRAEALDLLTDRLKQEGVADGPGTWAVWAGCPFLDGLDRQELSARVPGLRFDVSRESAAGALVGISQLDWGIAETGSIAQDATSVDARLVSTLPTTHIALLPSDRLVPDLRAFLAVQGPSDANYLSVITGPSRTADIERVLTIGVHGPERLVVIVVDELGEAQ